MNSAPAHGTVQTTRTPILYPVATVIGTVLAATVLRMGLTPELGTSTPFITFFLAVVVTSWLYGFWPGLATSILSGAFADYYFLLPTGSLEIHEKGQALASFIFILEGLALSALGEAQLRARKSAQQNAISAQQSLSALRQSEEHLRLATEGAGIGTWSWNSDSRILNYSEQMKTLFGLTSLSEPVYEDFRNMIKDEHRDVLSNAVAQTTSHSNNFSVEFVVELPGNTNRWLEVRGHTYFSLSGRVVRVEGVAIDITARKLFEQSAAERADRADALNKIGTAIRESRDQSEIQNIALAELGSSLQCDRCLLILLNEKEDRVSFVDDWHKPELHDVRGEYSLSDFDVDLDQVFPKSIPLVINNVLNDDWLSAKSAAMLQSLQISALIDVPLTASGEVIGVLGAYMTETREWSEDEVKFVEAVASQMRAATEAARVLVDAESRAEREALINRIGDSMRIASGPDEVQLNAVTLLGQALGADRCYFAIYDLENEEVHIGNDWHSPNLPSAKGTHAYKNTREMFLELYPKDSVSITVDRDVAGFSEQTIENMKSLQIRSRLSVAIADSKGMATLTATMADGPRIWTADEVELIKKVAAQLRPSVEVARFQQREHRIANDLQAALIPGEPPAIPGVKVGACMQAALDEAEIGGDFFDVFALQGSSYALVIGDVSGKGLTAAAQLALVKNSLRTCLYLHDSLSEALNSLNSIVTSRKLLGGFVTLFVGVYETRDGSLRYATCGHEPALKMQCVDAIVTQLSTGGLPIGIDLDHFYIEDTTILHPGDSLLIYTDGLTEAGPSRAEMLEVSGLSHFFLNYKDQDIAQTTVQDLVSDVKKYAKGILRDDVCALMIKRDP